MKRFAKCINPHCDNLTEVQEGAAGYCGLSCARFGDARKRRKERGYGIVQKSIMMTDFGHQDTCGRKQITDEEMKKMHAVWLKILTPEKYEPEVMDRLIEIIEKSHGK